MKFKNIKPGDEIIAPASVSLTWKARIFYIPQRVTRTTASQFMIGDTRYRKEDGKEVGRFQLAYLKSETRRNQAEEYRRYKTREELYRRMYQAVDWAHENVTAENAEHGDILKMRKAAELMEEAVKVLRDE